MMYCFVFVSAWYEMLFMLYLYFKACSVMHIFLFELIFLSFVVLSLLHCVIVLFCFSCYTF